MLYFRMLIRWVIFILLLGLTAGCARRERVVARIGRGEVITLRAFKEDFSRGRSDKDVQSADLSLLRKHLERMIDKRLKLMAAYEMGLDRDSTLRAGINVLRERLLLQRLYDTEIVDRVVKESDIRDFYARTAKQVKIRRILFTVSPQAKPEEEEAVWKKAEGVLQRIRGGEDFAVLAKEVSEDNTSKGSGGMVGYISWTRSNDPVQRAAFSMGVGEVSGLVRNNLGYNIIKVEDIRENERQPYGEARDGIRRTLIGEKRDVIAEDAKAYWEKVREKSRIRFSEDGLNSLIDRMKSVSNQTRNVVLDSLENLTSEEKQVVLVQYLDGEMDVRAFQEKVKDFPAYAFVQVNDSEALKSTLERLLMADILSGLAVEKGLDKDASVVTGVERVREERMVALFDRRQLEDSVQPTDEEVRRYYEAHADEKYSEPEMVKVQEVMVQDQSLAEKIYRWAEGGRDFGQLALAYTERHGLKNKDGIMDYFPRGRWGAVGEKAFTLKKGEIAGPIPLVRQRGYSVIKLLDRKPPRVKPFEDVKEKVVRDLRTELKKERDAAWLAERRGEVPVQVYDHVLETAFHGY